jgi:RimJ/RimL family protein N-acetyltransferase
VIFPPYRRRGFATRASQLALEYAAQGLGATSAVIKVLDGNAASLGVARSLGAEVVGHEPSDAGGRFVVFRLPLPVSRHP